VRRVYVTEEAYEALVRYCLAKNKTLRGMARETSVLIMEAISQKTNIPLTQNPTSPSVQYPNTPLPQNPSILLSQQSNIPQTASERPEQRRSPLDELEDVALIRNVRDMTALRRRCEEKKLLLYTFDEVGLPSTVAVIRPSYAEFVKSSAEHDYTPPSKLEDKLINILRGKPHDLDPEEKYIVTLFALSFAGELIYDGKKWVTPEKKAEQQPQQQQQVQEQQEQTQGQQA
jgi:hypothetical protein